MKVTSPNIVNINEKYLVVKKTNSGYLYYNNYRQTGSRETYYAALFDLTKAEEKMKWLQSRTKGKFSIISAKEVFCNSWRFTLEKPYGESEYSLKVSNEPVAVARVKTGIAKPNNFEKALAKLKADCEITINRNKEEIQQHLKQIAAIENTIAELKKKGETLTSSTTGSELENSIKHIVEANTVPADMVVSVLFGKAE